MVTKRWAPTDFASRVTSPQYDRHLRLGSVPIITTARARFGALIEIELVLRPLQLALRSIDDADLRAVSVKL